MLTTIEAIPAPWKSALSAIQKIDLNAVIAGGCLRDLDNGREVKDIDIFVEGRSADALFGLHRQLVDAGLDCAEIDPEKMYPIGDGNDLIGCIDITFDECPPLQVIMVYWPLDRLLERFDFGICKVSFDGQCLTFHQDYSADKREQVFRLRRERTGSELVASVHRFARLNRKYENWRFELYTPDDSDFF
jgi:hypothetical protein